MSLQTLCKQIGFAVGLLFTFTGCSLKLPPNANLSTSARPLVVPEVAAASTLWNTKVEVEPATQLLTSDAQEGDFGAPILQTPPPPPIASKAMPLVTSSASIKTGSIGPPQARYPPGAVPDQPPQPAQPSDKPILAEPDFVAKFSRVAATMVSASKDEYKNERGLCACPEDMHFDGQLCGERSGYYGPKHNQPLCYISDVTPEMAADYTRTKSLMFSVR